MRKLIILIISLLPGYTFTSCNGHSQPVLVNLSANPGSYQWTEQTPAASFPKSYNFQLFTVRDTLWAFHPAGTWYSVNGKDWAKSQLPNSINNLAFLDYVAFGNKILGLGHFEGNIEKFSLATEIYQTTDMRNWSVLAKESNLPKRFFYHPFVFKNKIWIIGGSNGTDSFADVWNSDDGVHWVKRGDNMPFGKREGDQFIVFNDRIYMLGNDVWSSDDGLNWKQETKEIVPGESIFGYASLVFDNKIWLLGCNRNGTFKSEILTSPDGKQWEAHRAPWSPRGGVAACIYNGEIFITGGKYGGPGIDGQTEFVYSNDVWSLKKV